MNILYANSPHAQTGADPFDYSHTLNSKSYQPINTGDVLVCHATEMLFKDHSRVGNIQLSSPPDDKTLKSLVKKADLLVIRGSNYITAEHDMSAWNDVIKKIDLPTMLVGVGVQHANREMFDIPSGSKEFFKTISERSIRPIGTRGEYSSQLLAHNGISNSLPLGCPTIIRSGEPKIRIKKPKKFDNWSLTINRQLKSAYASSNYMLRYLQKELISKAITDTRATILAQGEKEETLLAHQLAKDEDKFTLARFLSYGPKSKEFEQFRIKLRSFLSTSEWDSFFDGIGFSLGFRLHGNILPLTKGVPTVFLKYDSRTDELVDLLKVPYVDIAMFPKLEIDALYKQADFSKFETQYRKIYKTWQQYLAGLSTLQPQLDIVQNANLTPNRALDIGQADIAHTTAALSQLATEHQEISNKLWAKNHPEKVAESKKPKVWGLTE